MQKSLLSSVIQTAGFAIIGALFFIWYMGHQKNTAPLEISPKETDISRAEISVTPRPDSKESRYTETYANSDDYANRRIKAPEPVTNTYESNRSSSATTDRASLAPSVNRSRSNTSVKKASAVRSWKGVHRDESFAWLCFDRFGQEVVNLSDKHGLYADVFLSRIIAYSYEFTKDPRVSPADNNFTALTQPKNKDRARFRSVEESLKAYAVLHAGEVKRLSREGAIAKNDRAWTMRKIIDGYTFVSNLNSDHADYSGRIGRANKASEQENHQREMVGEAIKMVSTVDDIVKKRRAETAGYSNWEDYLDDLTDEERLQQTKAASSKTTAISKKKAFNLSRRVNAKKRKQD